jgi:hypothetical protein
LSSPDRGCLTMSFREVDPCTIKEQI